MLAVLPHNGEKSLDESLAALGVEYVDLFLQHWPAAFKSDENGQPPRPTDSEGNVMLAEDPKAFVHNVLQQNRRHFGKHDKDQINWCVSLLNCSPRSIVAKCEEAQARG